MSKITNCYWILSPDSVVWLLAREIYYANKKLIHRCNISGQSFLVVQDLKDLLIYVSYDGNYYIKTAKSFSRFRLVLPSFREAKGIK